VEQAGRLPFNAGARFELILLGGVLGLASILAGLISRRVEMAGGAVLGLSGGWALAQALRHLRLEASLAPVLVLAGGLAIFGLSQLLGTSGLLVTYLAAATPGASEWISRVSSPATNRSGRTLKKGAESLANSRAALQISLMIR
jgi:NhaP-type Na+/H+ and K+/H+ antiporter